MNDLSRRFRNASLWGLRPAPHHAVRARVIELRWRWPILIALASTVPAFYAELLLATPPPLARLDYLLTACLVGGGLLHIGWRSGALADHLGANPLDLVLVAGLLLAAALPASSGSETALGLRLAVAGLTLVRALWALQHLITRGSVSYMLMLAAALLVLAGFGYWALEPSAKTLGDGLWLALVTASTIGYGDIVPTTPAAKIFSFFVVMLGFSVLSLVTAAIATRWVETEERTIEREILRNVHREIDALRHEIAALRQELILAREHEPFVERAAAETPPAAPRPLEGR